MNRFPKSLLAFGLGLLATLAQADRDAPFTWEVEGGKTRHYLIGSVHLLPGNAGEIPDGLQDIYDNAEGLVFETDLDAIAAPEVQTGLMSLARSARGLKADVGVPVYAKVQAYLARLSVRPDACAPFKPWFCSLTLEVLSYRRAGFDGDNGLDEQLDAEARQDGKRITWFEEPAAHLALFTEMSDALSKRLLESTLDESNGAADEPQRVFGAWRKDDFAAIEKITATLKRSYPDLYARLLADRNRAWSRKLEAALARGEPQMIVVGAAHLAGPEGLIASLRARGYRLRPYVTLPAPQLETHLTPGLQAVRLPQKAS